MINKTKVDKVKKKDKIRRDLEVASRDMFKVDLFEMS